MNLRKHLTIAAAAAALLAGTALPASAATTDTTFTLTGGSLTLSVQSAAALTNAATTVDASTIAGSLGATSVDDARGEALGWVVSGVSTAFTGLNLSSSTSVMYSPLVIVETGTNTVTAASADTVIGTSTALLTTTASGNNTASWTPGLKVNMPAGALAGNYSGTVTTSIA